MAAEPLTEVSSEALARVVEVSRRVLMHERLMHGAWGKTMKTYLRLTQPPSKWSSETSELYRRLGSVTHTHHALKALLTYHELIGMPFNVTDAISVTNYMATWQLATGDVPAPVTNLAESMPSDDPLAPDWPANREYWASMLRHTGTALTSMISLIRLLDVEPKVITATTTDPDCMTDGVATTWAEEAEVVAKCQGALRRMAELATRRLAHSARPMVGNILLADGTWPQVVYSPAYVIAAVHEGNAVFGRQLELRDQHDLQNFEDFLLDYLSNHALGKNETYLCERQYPESCYYYTLVILDHYLSVIYERIDYLTQECPSRQILRMAEDLLLKLSTIVKRNKGLPIGWSRGTKQSVDIGTTARFTIVVEELEKCVSQYGASLPKEILTQRDQALKSSVEMIESATGLSDLMTHSLEALVRIVDAVPPKTAEEIAQQIAKVNQESHDLRTTDGDKIAQMVKTITEATGIRDDNLPFELCEKLFENEHFRSVAGEHTNAQSMLARFSNPVLFHQLLYRTFDYNQLREFCRTNKVYLPPQRLQKDQIIRLLMAQFEIGTPPDDDNERQMASDLLRIERGLRKFIETIVPNHRDLAIKMRELTLRRRGTDANDPLYPEAEANVLWEDAEFSHLWALINWRWSAAKLHFQSAFYGQDDGARRKTVRIYLEQVRRIRNRVFHLHGEFSDDRDIADDRRFIDSVGETLLETLNTAIEDSLR